MTAELVEMLARAIFRDSQAALLGATEIGQSVSWEALPPNMAAHFLACARAALEALNIPEDAEKVDVGVAVAKLKILYGAVSKYSQVGLLTQDILRALGAKVD